MSSHSLHYLGNHLLRENWKISKGKIWISVGITTCKSYQILGILGRARNNHKAKERSGPIEKGLDIEICEF